MEAGRNGCNPIPEAQAADPRSCKPAGGEEGGPRKKAKR